MEQVHAPVKGKSSGKAADASADNNDAMGFLLHVSFLVYSPSPSSSNPLWPYICTRGDDLPVRINEQLMIACSWVEFFMAGKAAIK